MEEDELEAVEAVKVGGGREAVAAKLFNKEQSCSLIHVSRSLFVFKMLALDTTVVFEDLISDCIDEDTSEELLVLVWEW